MSDAQRGPADAGHQDEELHEELLESRELHRGRYLTFRLDRVRRADGSEATRLIEVPGLLSFLGTGSFDGTVEGINDLKASERAMAEKVADRYGPQVGALVLVYCSAYFSPTAQGLRRFGGVLTAFAGAMVGLVTADDMLLLFVFWELTSISSYFLIGFDHERDAARAAALQALLVTGGGGLALLAGVLLLGQAGGSLEISTLLEKAELVRAAPLYVPIVLLVLAAAFTKSAQVPFHFWLPGAMEAPTPVSAYLHSATMVKAGVFLLARLYPILGGTPLFMYVVATVGLVTFVFGAYVAVFKHDLKGLLAYSTISHLGLITFLIGLDSPLSNVAAMFHVGNHATFKASLFMAAGIVEHEAGTRDMRRLSGLWKHMPYTATLAIVAADNCDAAVACRIESASSNEPENGLGDGDTAPDSTVTGDFVTMLRAERSGTGNGRTYTVQMACRDAAGNTSTAQTTVTVPKNQSP